MEKINKIFFANLLFIHEITSLLNVAEHNLEAAEKLKKDYDKAGLLKKINNTQDAENWIDIHFYNYDFIPTIFHSLFVGMYSKFESFLKDVATLIELSNNKPININDLKSNGIVDKYRKFLHLVHSIKSADSENKEWVKFETFQWLRNKIVHNESKLTTKPEQDFKSSIGYKILTEYHANRIRPNGEFKIEDLQFLEDFGALNMDLAQSINLEIHKSNLNCD